MAVRVIGKVAGFSENREAETEIKNSLDLSPQEKEAVEEEKENNALNNVQEPPRVSRLKEKINAKEDNFLSENKEIAFFTEPKKVSKKTQKHILAFQSITAASICLVMLLLHLCAPELYDNLRLYFLRLFRW